MHLLDSQPKLQRQLAAGRFGEQMVGDSSARRGYTTLVGCAVRRRLHVLK